MSDNYDIKMLYPIIEIAYIKANGREISIDPNTNADLFPAGWYAGFSYEKKIAILKEAINKKILITETELYQENIEGVRNSL